MSVISYKNCKDCLFFIRYWVSFEPNFIPYCKKRELFINDQTDLECSGFITEFTIMEVSHADI